MNDRRPVAIVTGGGSGIGKATVERLARNGWAVVAADMNEVGLAAFADEFGDDRVVTAVADASSAEDNDRLVDLARMHFGGLNATILNAGIATTGSILSIPLSDIEKAHAVNTMGVFHGVRSALPELRKASNPAIVVTASMNGLGGDNSFSAYCASKFGAVGAVKALAREIGFEGIRINAVCPGATRTGMTIAHEKANPETAAALDAQAALGRRAEPDEIAAVIEFLASPLSSYITGVALPVDGGASAGVGLKAPARSHRDLQPAGRR